MPPTEAHAVGGDPCPTGLRVLVADDVAVVRRLMVRLVTRQGHCADEASDGQEAIDALGERQYDLLLLDLSMPHVDGIGVVRWLNANPEQQRDLTVAVVSAAAREERPTLTELGVTLILPKPFRDQQFAEVVDDIRAQRTAH